MRFFNERAVPGLGNVWFGRQVVLALFGVRLAEEARKVGRRCTNIAAANAVEALAVWLTLQNNGWSRNERLPGFLKLQRHRGKEPPSFKEASSTAFYVTQPMRIGTGDALVTLGLVSATSSRFNSYTVTDRGQALLDLTCEGSRRALQSWAAGDHLTTRRRPIAEQLDPTRPLPDGARELLRNAFLAGDDFERARRRQALAFVEAIRVRAGGHVAWDMRPPEIEDAEHWADMRAGAALSAVVEAAAGEGEGGSVLGRIEAHMGAAGLRKLALHEAADSNRDAALRAALDHLRAQAQSFLSAHHDPSPGQAATRFCADCAEADAETVVARLVARDGRILRLVDGFVLAGSAFRGQPVREQDPDDLAEAPPEEGPDEPPEEAVPALPAAISRRIRNLAALAPDLHAAPAGTTGA
ncbi:hypothetical protein [Aureimonas ureilytica]|uniref:hypothetical protein n=1 Tax=Aureimonas ureilytica TaxID=401562 RepID=UPI00039D0486|nr:hypothetical protein [Aureimonas ureilytica]